MPSLVQFCVYLRLPVSMCVCVCMLNNRYCCYLQLKQLINRSINSNSYLWDVRLCAFFSGVLHIFVLACVHVCVRVHVRYQILSLFAYKTVY